MPWRLIVKRRYATSMPRADTYRAEVEKAERELIRRTPRENLRVAWTLRTLKSGLAEREQCVLDEAAADFERRADVAQTSPNSA